jgi:hypothetical protein
LFSTVVAAALAVSGVTPVLAGEAAAAEMPKSMIGTWCFSKTAGQYWLDYFEDKCSPEDHMKVTPSGYWFPGADSKVSLNCNFVAIKKTQSGYQTHSKCTKDGDPYDTWEFWDNPPITPGSHERPWLRVRTKGTAANLEIPYQLIGQWCHIPSRSQHDNRVLPDRRDGWTVRHLRDRYEISEDECRDRQGYYFEITKTQFDACTPLTISEMSVKGDTAWWTMKARCGGDGDSTFPATVRFELKNLKLTMFWKGTR